jgi:hypothetical protein
MRVKLHPIDFKIAFPSTKIPSDIADIGKLQNHGQFLQDMMRCYSSFVKGQDKPGEAFRINFHLFALSMIQTTLF